MREQSTTRRQLEASIRALLPSREELEELTPSKNSAASVAGVGDGDYATLPSFSGLGLEDGEYSALPSYVASDYAFPSFNTDSM